MLRGILALAGVVTLGGCITPYPDISQSRSPCRMEPGGWCGFVREAAVKSYPYAMLSSNAYEDKDEYDAIPPAFKPRGVANNDDVGLAFSVFDRFEINDDGSLGDLKARVIAFRGTEFGSVSDIFSGSLGSSQIDRARIIYANERAFLDSNGKSDVAIELAGHSLGGALSTQLSIENPGVKAFVFNSSPLFKGDPTANDAERFAVSEHGEFLRLLRQYKASPAADFFVVNCSPTASASAKHSIRKLADCLTWIAAYEDEAALGLLAPNAIRKPEVECGEDDKIHPGRARDPNAVCVHQVSTKPAE